jgi:hypothetical protein
MSSILSQLYRWFQGTFTHADTRYATYDSFNGHIKPGNSNKMTAMHTANLANRLQKKYLPVTKNQTHDIQMKLHGFCGD